VAAVGVHHQEDNYLEILSRTECGNWILSLPPVLRIHQQELEQLLGKVFAGRPQSDENLALAKQMSLNWCFSKCRQAGMALEDCWREAS
jgi:hypothetical protein